jgi:hypothetical protein
MQTAVLEQVSQLTTLSQQMLKSQVGTCNESISGLNNEAPRDKPVELSMKNHEVHHYCKQCGFSPHDCSNGEDGAIMKQTHGKLTSQKRKVPCQEQLLEDSLQPKEPIIDLLQLVQGGNQSKNHECTWIRSLPPVDYIDGWTITCTEFQPPRRKRSRKKAVEVMKKSVDSQWHLLTNASQPSSCYQHDPSPHVDKLQYQDQLLPTGVENDEVQRESQKVITERCDDQCEHQGHYVGSCVEKYSSHISPSPNPAQSQGEECDLTRYNEFQENLAQGNLKGRICYTCLKTGHLSKECLQKTTQDRPANGNDLEQNQQPCSTSQSQPQAPVPMSRPAHRPVTRHCYNCGDPRHYEKACPQKLPLNQLDQRKNTPRQQQRYKVNRVKPSYVCARMKNATIEDAQNAQNVVLGTCEVNAVPATVLFDSKATHSFIMAAYAKERNLPMHPMKKPMHVSTPRGEIKANHICPRVCLKIRGVDFPADLVVLESEGIDVILGMNWLAARKTVGCDTERLVSLTIVSGEKIEYVAPSALVE